MWIDPFYCRNNYASLAGEKEETVKRAILALLGSVVGVVGVYFLVKYWDEVVTVLVVLFCVCI